MNREQAKELLPIIQVFVEGKTIEFRERGCTLWAESISPIFNFAIFLNIASSQSPSIVHLRTLKSAGRKCKSISRSGGLKHLMDISIL